jgi:site-specific recombinase XerD
LCPFARPYIALLRGQGYQAKTVRTHLHLIASLNRWLAHHHHRLRDLDEQVVARFLRRHRLRRKACCGALPALHRLLKLLRQGGVTPPVQAIPLTPTRRLTDEYRQHFLRERGFAQGTVVNYTRQVDRFLAWRLDSRRGDLAKLRAGEAPEFVQHLACGRHPAQAKPAAIALRSFLRYLHYCGRVPRDLSSTMPPVAHWRQTELPKYLPVASVRVVLESCEQSSALGLRNYAILLLLARLGLRAGEIVSLRLEDIDWDHAHLLIRSRKGRGLARLPLLAEVGRAIARYLREGRAGGRCRNLFVRADAPHVGLSGSGAISALARRAMQKAGVVSPHTGAHVFRHSLATTLLERGATLDEIGQVLRHQDPDTTALYAKVQLAALRPLALPWPGGAQ